MLIRGRKGRWAGAVLLALYNIEHETSYFSITTRTDNSGDMYLPPLSFCMPSVNNMGSQAAEFALNA